MAKKITEKRLFSCTACEQEGGGAHAKKNVRYISTCTRKDTKRKKIETSWKESCIRDTESVGLKG